MRYGTRQSYHHSWQRGRESTKTTSQPLDSRKSVRFKTKNKMRTASPKLTQVYVFVWQIYRWNQSHNDAFIHAECWIVIPFKYKIYKLDTISYLYHSFIPKSGDAPGPIIAKNCTPMYEMHLKFEWFLWPN